jgi:hypothetical protein
MDSFGLSVGNREARADRQRGKLVDRIASGTPIRKLLFIEAFLPPPLKLLSSSGITVEVLDKQ